jgi:hypothetical protein
MGQSTFVGTVEVTVDSGQTVSSIADIAGNKVAAIYCPTGLTATEITFQATPNAGPGSGAVTFRDVFDDLGVQYTAQVAADRVVALDSSAMALAGVRFVKLVLGTAAPSDLTFYILTTN